ncbi:unnamed protein product [Arctia plantaginis]|uniref:Uncharacterized protein n=1 Tax=Arctia plantaginis TaxID=874455 RepID=A0A8S1B1Z4_ARCPL|nr:unnamed protein product [Arctia plantaginis]
MFKLFFSIIVLFFYSCNTQVSNIEELKQKYVEMILECSGDFPISAVDLDLLKNKKMPDNQAIKCLFACVYKKAGMMNDKGELWIEGVNEMTRKYLSNDLLRMKKSEEFTAACKSVNDVPVSDGIKGCERAALIFKCTVEKAPAFDFV